MCKLGVAALVFVVSCGGKKEEATPAPASASAKPEMTGEKPAAKPDDKPADKPVDTSRGTCKIVTTGAVAVEQTSGNSGPSTISVVQWLPPETRKQLGYGDEGLILNCLGKDARINILTKRDQPFPMKPGSYQVGKGGSMTVMGALGPRGSETHLSTVDGTIEITAFDASRIAGKGTLKAKALAGKGDIELAIDFDMQCTQCPK